jgi:hypothetical protein
MILTIMLVSATVLSANNYWDGIADSEKVLLAQQYAPILHFSEQEQLFPVNVEYYFQHSVIKRIGDNKTIASAPLDGNILRTYRSPIYYIDNTLGKVEDDKIIEAYRHDAPSSGYTVYARVTRTEYEGKTYYIIQYWMFYVFNNGKLNRHEGDWEFIQVELDKTRKPIAVSYSQHRTGERVFWNDVDKEGTHPRVYVALGSHANYPKPYEGRVGLASDVVDSAGVVLKPSDYRIVMLGSSNTHSEEQAWLEFAGYWGELTAQESILLGEAGPKGPMFAVHGLPWNDPVGWSAGLLQADRLWFFMNWLVYYFVPLFLAAFLIVCAIRIFLIHKTHKKHGLGPRYVSLLYIDGFNIKSVGNALMLTSLVLGMVALMLPWYYINANVKLGNIDTNGNTQLLYIDGISGVQVGFFAESSVTQLFGLGLPFSLILSLGFALFLLSLVGLRKSSKAGRKYIFRGIRNLIPVIIILIVIANLGAMVMPLINMLPLQKEVHEDVTQNAKHIFDSIAASPFYGSAGMSLDFNTLKTNEQRERNIRVEWGLGIGAYLLIVAGILAIVGGIFEIAAREEFY